MRFRSSKSPIPYLNKRDQLRLLSLFVMLALVLIAIKMTANPEFWHWLVPPQVEKETTKSSDSDTADKQIDFGVRGEDESPLKPGEFRSRGAPTPPSRDGRSPSAADVEIDKEMLKPIRDNTLGIRAAEADAFYAILAKARDVPSEELEQAAHGHVDFTVLMVDSDHFRGQLITVEGDLKRLSTIKAGENEHGIEEFYEAWVFTDDSGNNPYRIVCTGIPENIPQDFDITPPVRIRATGYFFKRESYASPGGTHTAPTLLAKRLSSFRPQPVPAADHRVAPYLIAFVVFVAAALGLALWRFTAGDELFYRRHIKRITEAPREAIDALADVETTNPDDMFRQLTEQAHTAGAEDFQADEGVIEAKDD